MQRIDNSPCAVQAYYRVYKEHIPVAQLCREVAAVMQEFTRERRSLILLSSQPTCTAFMGAVPISLTTQSQAMP